MGKSFLNKIILLLIIVALLIIFLFFFINKDALSSDIENVEKITNLNINTYDYDLYIYKLDDNKIYTSEFFYNQYYLLNNSVSFDEFEINGNTNFYLKVLSNTEKELDNISVSYEKINLEQFNFILNNNSLLKVYLWVDENLKCKNVLLYSTNDIELEVIDY